MTNGIPKQDPLEKYALRATEAGNTAQSQSINNGVTYSTTTYMFQMNVDGYEFIDISMFCTVPDAAISGDLTYSWLLTNNANWPKQASFTSKMTPTRNVTADRANQCFDVRGYKYLKLLSIANASGQNLTAVNAEVTGKG